MERAEQVAARQVFETGIPMRDGIELAADVYLPSEVGSGGVPAIVEVTPYNKDNVVLMADDAELYPRNGYAFVCVDVRGRGKSEGEWVAFLNDARDTHDVIEWAAAQPWCNGKVGTTGLSYMGWVQWAAASERPAHLKAMISTSAAGRWQQEIPYTNGVFQLYFAWWALVTRRRIEDTHLLEGIEPEQLLERLPFADIGELIDGSGPSWEILSRRPTLDELWRSLRYDDRYDEIDVPCLHVTGWYDLEDLLGAFHHYEHMVAASPAGDSQYLLVGPWSHVKSRYPDREYGGVDFGEAAALDMDAEHVRFFDHFLKGADNGVAGLDRVRIFEPGRNAWRGAAAWPLADSETSFFLAAGGALAAAAPVEDSSAGYDYDPLDPVRMEMDVHRYPFEDVPLDQSRIEQRADVLVWTSEPLGEALTISGWPRFELFASSDGEDTDWHVKLTDVTPDGSSLRVSQGCLRGACRNSLESPEPLVPGRIERFQVELWPTHHVFLPGHRVRVTVTSSDFPWFARNLNRFGMPHELAEPRVAHNVVAEGGVHASRLVLPVEIPASA
jgi:putative CocE/NonD family hydrolase